MGNEEKSSAIFYEYGTALSVLNDSGSAFGNVIFCVVADKDFFILQFHLHVGLFIFFVLEVLYLEAIFAISFV